MSDDNKDQGFRVEDKRRFDADGTVRTGEELTEEERGGVAEEPSASSGSSGSDPAAAAAAGELSFSSFMVGLASQAVMFLGAVGDPTTGLVTKDLGQAKALIDIIAMLDEKTAGNLNEDEARMMEEMLYELRMHYVEATRNPAPPADGPEK